jgi:thiamine pyrophosphokinase
VHAIVIAGGDPPTADELTAISTDTLVIAADSGIGPLHGIGRVPHAVVGDLDSADPVHVATARDAGARVERHPEDKDATDLELALGTARDAGADRVTVLGLGGGRLDHLLANLLLLAHPAWADLVVDARTADATLTVVRATRTLTGSVGGIVTLLPLGGPAIGITTEGLRWPLRDETLVPATTRGVSNEIETAPARVHVRDGVLLAVEPMGD